eukprot:m.113640 g.113640  ORF g.113640 m.113640 type:complete len:140 (-) comp13028_c0_seq5:904-1323(-)
MITKPGRCAPCGFLPVLRLTRLGRFYRTKKLLGSLGHPEHTEIPHMPFAEFMSDCLGTLTTREGKSLRCYWAGSLPETLLSYVPTHTQDFQPTSELKATRAWISTGGVSAQTHYDTYVSLHNSLISDMHSRQFSGITTV